MSDRRASPRLRAHAHAETDPLSSGSRRTPHRQRNGLHDASRHPLLGEAAAGGVSPAEIAPHEITLQTLRTDAQIAGIRVLREQIRLPAAVLADPGFAALEKKGTGRASWAPCRGGASRSAP